ncbi:MAG: HXXEE domain-containing protein [Promethearchaeota archaeon]
MFEKFNRVWPIIGGILAVLISIIVGILWISNSSVSRLSLIYWLNLAVLMLHEFEEYVIPGGFKKFINTKTVLSLPKSDIHAPITESVIVIINLGAWLLFLLGALMVTIAPWLGLAMVVFNVINILGHVVVFQVKVKGYNPGLVTAFLMIPFLIFAFWIISRENLINTQDFFLALVLGIISAASLPIFGALIRKKELSK